MLIRPKPLPRTTFDGKLKLTIVEDVEELGTELDGSEFRAAPAAEGRVFNQSHVEVVKAGASKRAAAKCSEAAVVRSGAVCEIDGDVEKGSVVVAAAEVVGSHSAAG